ncbi:MAG: bacillithiol system protein YtxJ [Cognaticolwellia sp.]|jgi:bacillithiol system protein YtxJ
MSFWNKSKDNNQEITSNDIDWKLLDTEDGLNDLKTKSETKPQVIFKHSTRCSISSMAKRRLERNWNINESQVDIHYLDLISYRSISGKVADDFGVTHQSPQILIIKNGQAVFNTSHNDIDVETIAQNL